MRDGMAIGSLDLAFPYQRPGGRHEGQPGSEAAPSTAFGVEKEKKLREPFAARPLKILYSRLKALERADGGMRSAACLDIAEDGDPSFMRSMDASSICQWGHEFRPAYRVSGEVCATFSLVARSICLYVAEATESVAPWTCVENHPVWKTA